MTIKFKRAINSFELEPVDPDAWDLLSQKLNEGRRLKMLRVAAQRTSYIRLALQDVHDPHNVGACLRSAEALGIQSCDMINLYQKFPRPSKVSRGAFHWMDIFRFKDVDLYAEEIKRRGYRLAAAFPANTDCVLDEVPIDQPVVVVFGNERDGLHDAWKPHIDCRFSIPMVGMVESFNISVSVAVSLYSLTQRCSQAIPKELYLPTQDRQEEMLNRWISMQSRAYTKELARLRAAAALKP